MQLIGRIDVLFMVTPGLGFEWSCYCTYVLLMVRTNVSYFAQLFYPVVRRVSECFKTTWYVVAQCEMLVVSCSSLCGSTWIHFAAFDEGAQGPRGRGLFGAGADVVVDAHMGLVGGTICRKTRVRMFMSMIF